MTWLRSPIIPVLLLAGNLLLVLMIFGVWWSAGEGAPAPQPRPPAAAAKTAVGGPPQNISNFRVIATKNLFSPHREGPAPDAAAAQGPGSLENSSLLGVLIIGADKTAIISPPHGPARVGQPGAPGQADVVHIGERWNGFTVLNITPEGVVLQDREGQKTLKFPE
jgi:hypothetical protein